MDAPNGQLVNIPVLAEFVTRMYWFRIRRVPGGIGVMKSLERNAENWTNSFCESLLIPGPSEKYMR